MAYFKDPNVERLYDIANKSNVKKQAKKEELINDFINIMDNIVKDINIPSRRTFTFGEESHLINVALYRNNDWLYNILLERYKDSISFNTKNHCIFSLYAAEYLPFNQFSAFAKTTFEDNELKSGTGYGLHLNVHGGNIYVDDQKRYTRELCLSSIRNKSSDIYNYLIESHNYALTKESSYAYGYVRAEPWFLFEVEKRSDLKDTIVRLDNLSSAESISTLSELYKNPESKNIALSSLNASLTWSSKIKEILEEYKIIEKALPYRDCLKTVFAHLFRTSQTIPDKEISGLVKHMREYLLPEEQLNLIFLDKKRAEEGKIKFELKNEADIPWNIYEALCQKDPTILEKLKRTIIPYLSYSDLSRKNNFYTIRQPETITKLIHMHSDLSLLSFGFDQETISSFLNSFFIEGLKSIRLNNIVNRNTYNSRYMDFFLNVMSPDIYADTDNIFKDKIREDGISSYIHYSYKYRRFSNLSPWILLSFAPEKSEKFLTLQENHEEILQQLVFFKTFHQYYGKNHCSEEEHDFAKVFMRHIDNCIDLLFTQSNKLHLQKESIYIVKAETLKNVDSSKDSTRKVLEIMNLLYEKMALNQKIGINQNVQKKRL